VRIESPGGGGFGDPRTREPERVARDVRLGFVSRDVARDVYGVATDAAGNVDLSATSALRKETAA
jgi:N-methylhydantoinase B